MILALKLETNDANSASNNLTSNALEVAKSLANRIVGMAIWCKGKSFVMTMQIRTRTKTLGVPQIVKIKKKDFCANTMLNKFLNARQFVEMELLLKTIEASYWKNAMTIINKMETGAIQTAKLKKDGFAKDFEQALALPSVEITSSKEMRNAMD